MKLKSLGFSAKFFGLRSLRAGGATAVVYAQVPGHLFKDIADGSQRMPKMAM